MQIELDLTAEELVQLEPIRVWWEERSRKSFSLDRTLSEWASLIDELERETYRGIDYDYANDLRHRDSLRDLLELEAFPESVARKVRAILEGLDSSFLSASTEGEDERIRDVYPGLKRRDWWWKRTPRNIEQVIGSPFAGTAFRSDFTADLGYLKG